jgi:OOP family OmpA-OmpF porin
VAGHVALRYNFVAPADRRASARTPDQYTQGFTMKKNFVALALVAAGAFGVSGVQANDLTGWFVNGGAGRANYHATVGNFDVGSAHGTAGILNVGYRTQFIGFEAGYTNLGSVSATSAGYKTKLSGDGWTLGLNGHFNVTDQWYISARTGLFLWKLHAKETGYAPNASYSSRASTQSIDGYAGVGTGFDIDRHWSVGANFDYYRISKRAANLGRADIGSRLFTVNAEYRF